MSRLRFALPLFAAIGCAPQNTQLTSGSFIAFLSDSNSASLATGRIDPTDEEAWNNEEEGTYTYNIDCREFETPAERQALRLPDPINICQGDTWPPEHEQWAERAAYRVVGGDLDAYRGDALVNSEGDVQFAFHHRLPGGEDFRWVFAVDPDFQPTTCLGDDQEGVIRDQLDGDWIEEWSRELREYTGDLPQGFEYLDGLTEDGRLFFINANAYQFDPEFQSTEDQDDRWFIPPQWQAAAAAGRFSEDIIEERSSRYGLPAFYEVYENIEPFFDEDAVLAAEGLEDGLWFCGADALPAGSDPRNNACMAELLDEMEFVEDDNAAEFRRLASPGRREADASGPVFTFRPMVHLNDWRTPDGLNPGHDGWGQIEYSWVVFSPESNLVEGGSASGAFQIMFEGVGSTSRVLVKGTFDTDRIRRDRWAAANLFELKAEENGVELCFEQ